jgi:hypothetical protein
LNGFGYAVMAGWLFSTATFGGDKNLLVLFTGAALFIYQSYQQFRTATQLRRDETMMTRGRMLG